MAIILPSGFKITTAEPVDSRQVLTKAEMLAMKKPAMPDVYFAICKDDGKMYVYNRNNEVDPETGRFRELKNANEVNPYTSLKKDEDYLYEAQYDQLDYKFANEWFDNPANEVMPSGCTSYRKGNFYGRKFDWLYNNCSEFVVKVPRLGDRFASFGVANTPLTKEFVESGEYDDELKIVPFKIVDGINEYGVVVNTNVVPVQKGTTTGTTPAIELRDRICNLMLPRYILDNFKTAQKAVNYIRDYVSVYNNKHLSDIYGYDIHVMVADADKTFILEFVDNELVILEHNIMTNFHIAGVEFNNNDKVYTPADKEENPNKDPMIVNKITSHGSGLERYNKVVDYYDSLGTKEEFAALNKALEYTNAYKRTTDPFWYTEFVGINRAGTADEQDVTVSSSIADFESYIVPAAIQAYEDRSRETGLVWQSVHSSIYDIAKRRLYLIAQENDKEFEFGFDYYTAEQVDKIVSGLTPEGTVKSVNNKLPDDNGNINLNIDDLGQEDVLILNCNWEEE